MKTCWTKGLESNQQPEMKQQFKEALVVRKRLQALLEEKIDESVRESRGKAGYASPAWPYKQADHRGYERALAEVISMISEGAVENS